MRHFILTFLCIAALNNLHSQAPGNVAENLVLWLKPANFTRTGSTATWADGSPSNNNFHIYLAGRRPKGDTKLVNYNSSVEFAGTTYANIDRDYLDGNRILPNGQTKFSVFTMAFPKTNTAQYASIIEFNIDQNSRFEIQNSATGMNFAIPESAASQSSSVTQTGLPLLRAAVGSSIADGTQVVTGLNGMDGVPKNSPQIISNTKSRISSTTRGPLNAYIGDIVVYNSNVSLINRRKIESYMALKYGVTLAENYVNTDGTVIYDVTTYNKNIIGLGRDNQTSLLQKQSHDASDSTRVYLSTLVTTNASNIGTIAQNISHLVMGDNGQKVSSIYNQNNEMPAGLFSRLQREWKVTRTNFAESFNTNLKLNYVALPGSVNPADLRFLVDDDGNFGNGGTTSYYNGDGSGIILSYAGGLITVSNISTTHIPNNSTRYFTIASVNVSTPLPIELIHFDALSLETQVALNWKTGSEKNNDYFTIERSVNGIEWLEVATVIGAGNSSTELNYITFDENPIVGLAYYRLKQTDFDAEFTYSDVKSVSFENIKDARISIFPNPAMNQFTIEGSKEELRDVRIFSVLGQEVTSMTEKVSHEATSIVFDISNLQSGAYYVNTKTSTSKVVKQ